MCPLIKSSGRGNNEKVLKILKYFLSFILKFETYITETDTKNCQIVCDNDRIMYTEAK